MLKKVLKVAGIICALIIIVPIALAFVLGFISSDESQDSDKFSPELSEGSLVGNTFTHPASGWTFKIPEGWQVQDAAKAQALYQESKKIVENSTGQLVQAAAKPSGELALINGPGNTLNFKFQPYDKERFADFRAVADMVSKASLSSYKSVAAQNGHQVKMQKSKKSLGQKEFEVVEISIQDAQGTQTFLTNRSYLAEINERLALITFTCVVEGLCTSMTKAVDSSSF